MLLLLLACFTADPAENGPNYNVYFASEDMVKAASIKSAQTKITNLDNAITNEPSRQRKGVLKAELLKAEKALEKAQAAVYPCYLPTPTGPLHMLGHMPECTVVAIVNETTAIVSPRVQNTSDSHLNIVLTRIETKDLRVRKPYKSDQLWHITATATTDKTLQHLLTTNNPYDDIRPGNYYIVEPLPKAEVKTAREQYDKKKKDQAKAQ